MTLADRYRQWETTTLAMIAANPGVPAVTSTRLNTYTYVFLFTDGIQVSVFVSSTLVMNPNLWQAKADEIVAEYFAKASGQIIEM
jgi:hypothetical protein